MMEAGAPKIRTRTRPLPQLLTTRGADRRLPTSRTFADEIVLVLVHLWAQLVSRADNGLPTHGPTP